MKKSTQIYDYGLFKTSVFRYSHFGPLFNPAEKFDRECMVSVLKKMAEQSSQNLLRNADTHLAKTKQNNSAFVWPKSEKTAEKMLALTY